MPYNQSINNKRANCRKGRAQPIATVIADLNEERFVSSTDFTSVGVDYIGPYSVVKGRRNEINSVVCSHVYM